MPKSQEPYTIKTTSTCPSYGRIRLVVPRLTLAMAGDPANAVGFVRCERDGYGNRLGWTAHLYTKRSRRGDVVTRVGGQTFATFQAAAVVMWAAVPVVVPTRKPQAVHLPKPRGMALGGPGCVL